MAKFRDIIEINDRPWNRVRNYWRAVSGRHRHSVPGAEGRRSPGKKAIEGNVTVSVQAFKR